MSKPRYSTARSGLYSDDSSRTGLDTPKREDITVPPTGLGQSGQSIKDIPADERSIWSYYSEMGEHYDKDLVEDANNTVEVLLIFAGLFSAVVTAFISQTYPMLKPDPTDILTSIYKELRSSGTNTTVDEPFIVPSYAVRVNCFLFAGLFTSMLVALLGILVKQWMRSYQRELAGVSSPHLRARIRHFRFNGAKRWNLASTVGLLSIFMHLALFISSAGIIDLLLSTAPTVGYVALSVFLLGASCFLVTTLLPLFVMDAPFRSSLSRLLSGMKREIEYRMSAHLHQLRTRKANEEEGARKAADKEGLEDQLEQTEGKANGENSIVRTRIHLDLDIICHLLSTADKSTERWLLDLCFEKLPELKLLEQQDPRSFYSRGIIIEVYNFLAKGCIMKNEKGEDQLNPHRQPRAKNLCKFLAWYLSLRRNAEEREELIRSLNKGGDPTILATLLAEAEPVPCILVATSALGRIEHLEEECLICLQQSSAVKVMVNSSGSRDEGNVRQVTSLLTKRTDCMLIMEKNNTQPPDKTAGECEPFLTALKAAFRRCDPTEDDKKLWVQILSDKEKGSSVTLKRVWFTPLLYEIQIMGKGSPHNPGKAASSGGTSFVLRPNALPFYPSQPSPSGYSSGSSPASPSTLASRPPLTHPNL